MKRIASLLLSAYLGSALYSQSHAGSDHNAGAGRIVTIMPDKASKMELSFVKAVETAFATTNTIHFAKLFCWRGTPADETLRKLYHQGDASTMKMWHRKLELRRVNPALETETVLADGTRSRANLAVEWKLIVYLSDRHTLEYLAGETNGVIMFATSTLIR